MTVFLAMFLKGFLLLGMLCLAWPIKRLVELKMKDGRLKRFLLISWK